MKSILKDTAYNMFLRKYFGNYCTFMKNFWLLITLFCIIWLCAIKSKFLTNRRGILWILLSDRSKLDHCISCTYASFHVTCIFKGTFKKIFSVNVWWKCTWKNYLTQLWFICFVFGDPPDIVHGTPHGTLFYPCSLVSSSCARI